MFSNIVCFNEVAVRDNFAIFMWSKYKIAHYILFWFNPYKSLFLLSFHAFSTTLPLTVLILNVRNLKHIYLNVVNFKYIFES